MHDPGNSNRLQALDKATKAAGIAIQIAMKVPAPLKSIADQVIRSASSVPANLAEGHGRSGRDRLHHYRIAYASAKEVGIHLDLLCISGAVPRGKATTAMQHALGIGEWPWPWGSQAPRRCPVGAHHARGRRGGC